MTTPHPFRSGDAVRVLVDGDTITDEQIRELNSTAQKAEEIMSSATALGLQPESYAGHREDARARCAEIWNARIVKAGGVL